jgi:predicted esterase
MSADSGLGLVHVYEPAAAAGEPTLLLLHGTGGDERDLLPLVPLLSPNAGALSPRGNVDEQGMPRFFRRLAPGVFDMEDLARRTDELRAFIDSAAAHYRIVAQAWHGADPLLQARRARAEARGGERNSTGSGRFDRTVNRF